MKQGTRLCTFKNLLYKIYCLLLVVCIRFAAHLTHSWEKKQQKLRLLATHADWYSISLAVYCWLWSLPYLRFLFLLNYMNELHEIYCSCVHYRVWSRHFWAVFNRTEHMSNTWYLIVVLFIVLVLFYWTMAALLPPSMSSPHCSKLNRLVHACIYNRYKPNTHHYIYSLWIPRNSVMLLGLTNCPCFLCGRWHIIQVENTIELVLVFVYCPLHV